MLFYGYKIAPGDTAELRIWLPLVSVRHHGRSCNSVKVEIKFHLEIHLTNVSESTEPGYRVCWLVNFFAWIRAMKTALEFVIWCSNRGLEIEVTTRQKKRMSAVSARACIRAWDLKVMRGLGSHPRPLSCNLIDFELVSPYEWMRGLSV